MTGHFDSDNHALRAGFLIGHLLRNGIDVAPVMDGKDYTDVLRIKIPTDEYDMRSIPVEVRILPPGEDF